MGSFVGNSVRSNLENDGSRVLREAGKVLALDAERDDILDKIAIMAANMVGATGASLVLREGNHEGFTVVARTGSAAGKAKGEIVPTGEGLAGRALAKGAIQGSRRLGMLSLPIVFATEVVGVLTVAGPKVTSLASDDIGNLEALAGQAAVLAEVRSCRRGTADSYRGIVVTFAEAVEARDPYTLGHSKAVRDYAIGIGKKLSLDERALARLELAGLLHDIGKLTISDCVLLKEGALSPAEMQAVKTHPAMGARLLEPVEYFRDIIPCVKHHHERYDGTGYPDGLKGKEIPFEARVLAIADAFDAMSSKRIYREFLTTDKILGELRKGKGSQFDPEILEAFLSAFEIDRRTYRAGEIRLSEVIHERHFDYYALAVRDSPEQAEKTVALVASITESLFLWLKAYAGPVVTERVEKKMNAYSIEHRLDFILSESRMETNMLVPVSLVEIIKRFQSYLDYLAKTIGDTLSRPVAKLVIDQASAGLDSEAVLLLDQVLSASPLWRQAA